MRKIMSSLFVIAAVLAVGVVATGAYFSDTITQDNYTFTTGNADLKLGFCGGAEGTDCTGVAATIDNITFSSPSQDVTTGPGTSGTECIVVENTGLVLSRAVESAVRHGLQPSQHGNLLRSLRGQGQRILQPALDASPVEFSDRRAHCRTRSARASPWHRAIACILTRNRWNSTGDQNYLQNGYLKLKTVLEGRTSNQATSGGAASSRLTPCSCPPSSARSPSSSRASCVWSLSASSRSSPCRGSRRSTC